jgi:hypothetical protein
MSFEKLIADNTAAQIAATAAVEANTTIQEKVLAALTSKTGSGATKPTTTAAEDKPATKPAPKKAAPKKPAAKKEPTGEDLVLACMEKITVICGKHPKKSDEQGAAIADIRAILGAVEAAKASDIPHDQAAQVLTWLTEYENDEVPEPLTPSEDESAEESDDLL